MSYTKLRPAIGFVSGLFGVFTFLFLLFDVAFFYNSVSDGNSTLLLTLGSIALIFWLPSSAWVKLNMSKNEWRFFFDLIAVVSWVSLLVFVSFYDPGESINTMPTQLYQLLGVAVDIWILGWGLIDIYDLYYMVSHKDPASAKLEDMIWEFPEESEKPKRH